MKNLFLILFAINLIFLMACGSETVLTDPNPQIQRDADVVIIETFFLEKGYSLDQIDTTESGVRYIILDKGQTEFDSLAIDESDIVKFDYIGRLTNDKLFDSSIDSIVINEPNLYQDSRDYEPFAISYTSSGWALVGNKFINGFSDGITATFGQVHIGAHILIVFPSDLGYRTVPRFGNDGVETIPANSVLTFEMFPVTIIKQ